MNRRTTFGLALIFAGVLLSGVSAVADTHYVSLSGGHTPPFTNWPTAATNIQAAIDAAVSNDTVLVTNGVYDTGGVVVSGSMTNRIAVTNAISVRSVNGPEVTVIVGKGPIGDSAVRCAHLGVSARLEGFTLTNGHTRASTGVLSHVRGGGAYCQTASVVSNCVIRGNLADSWAGGVYRGILVECAISENEATSGGGVLGSTLWNCTLQRNRASRGGGASVSTLNSCAVVGNTALVGRNLGGGISRSHAEKCLVMSNTAGLTGGGADQSSLVDCLVAFNRSLDRVGGADQGSLSNCTVVANEATNFGGGTRNSTMENCIVYHNTAGIGSPNYAGGTIRYTCTTPLPPGVGNITSDPQFVDLSTTNLRLKSTSPCIDAGAGESWMAGATDLDGLPRIINGTVDMGAYESPSPAITSISAPSAGPVITWASFTGAQYAVYGSTNLVDGYDLLLQDGIPAYPPENAFTDTVNGVELRGYAVEYTP